MKDITKLEAGQRVKVLAAPNHASYGEDRNPVGQIGVYVGPYERNLDGTGTIEVILDDKDRALPIRDNGSWVVSEWEWALPEVGQKVKALRVRGAEGNNGLIDEVTSIEGRDDVATFYLKEGWSIARGEWEPVVGLPAEEAPVVITELQAEVARLTALVAEKDTTITRAGERLTEQQSRYHNDMQHWENVLRRAKEDQNWCDSGTNEVIDRLNDGFTGGWEIDRYLQLVRKSVQVRGVTTCSVDVWVDEDDDSGDTDAWRDEDGNSIGDVDGFMQEALTEEFRRCSSEFDTVEVSDY